MLGLLCNTSVLFSSHSIEIKSAYGGYMAGQENLNISRSDSCSHIFLFLFCSHISKPKILPYNFVSFSNYQNLAEHLPKTIFRPHMYDILLPLNYQCHLNQ